MATKISQLPEFNDVTGDEIFPITISGIGTYKVRLSRVKSLITKGDVGLANVDNTSDLNKPVSTATQAALDGKANVSHNHGLSDVTGLQQALDDKANVAHQHEFGEVNGLQAALDAKANTAHNHDIESVTGLSEALTQKSNVGHTHAKSEVSGLQEDLNALQTQINNKAGTLHTHTVASIDGLDQAIVDRVNEILAQQPGGMTTEQITDLIISVVSPLLANKSDVGHHHIAEHIDDLDSFVDLKIATYASGQPPALTQSEVQAISLTVFNDNVTVIAPNLEW